MQIEEKVRLIHVKSRVNHYFSEACKGTYKDEFADEEGRKKVMDVIQEEIDIIANQAFNMGREYERKKK